MDNNGFELFVPGNESKALLEKLKPTEITEREISNYKKARIVDAFCLAALGFGTVALGSHIASKVKARKDKDTKLLTEDKRR